MISSSLIHMTDLPDVLLQRLVHPSLMCNRSVPVSHWHYRPLVEIKGNDDFSVLNVIRVHSSRLEEGIYHINILHPDTRSLNAVSKDVLYARGGDSHPVSEWFLYLFPLMGVGWKVKKGCKTFL
jgi:hypothetical protein